MINKSADVAVTPLPAWLVLTVLSVVAFTSNVNISLTAPILPLHYASIGVEQFWCGVMFSCFPIGMLTFSPPSAKAIARWGRAPVLAFGLVLQGFACVVFGYADQITGGAGENVNGELVVAVVSRIVCGAGGACANNAIFAIAVDRFPDRLGLVMGLNEVLIGAGFSLGPPIGQALYLSGGFATPFLLVGMLLLIFAPFGLLLNRPVDKTSQASCSLFAVLSPGMLIAAGCVVCGTGVFGFVEPLLAPYLSDKVGVPVAQVGAVFTGFAGTYSLFGFGMGALADCIGALRVCSIGILSSGLILAILCGPTGDQWPKGSSSRIGYEVIVLAVLGVAQAAALIPSLPAMKEGIEDDGPGATDAIVTWFSMFLQLGLAVSPLISSAMISTIGYEATMVRYGALISVYGAGAVAYSCRRKPAQPPTRQISAQLSSSSESPVRTPRVSRCHSFSNVA